MHNVPRETLSNIPLIELKSLNFYANYYIFAFECNLLLMIIAS